MSKKRIVNLRFWNAKNPVGYLSNRRYRSKARRFCRDLIAGEFGSPLTLLEVGIGGCNERIALDGRINANVKFIGVDVCENFVSHAQTRFPNDEWRTTDITQDAPMVADIVYSQHVLEHCPTLSPALDWMLKTAKRTVVNIFFRPPGEEELLQMKRQICTNVYRRSDIERVCESLGFSAEFHDFENRIGRDRHETVLVARKL
jgi:ubiquinone/menaquinone biosynthesis C-methylase UbiE